jgi:hypothetical protein
VTGVPHRMDFLLRGGLVAWICGPFCQAYTHCTPRRQHRPTRLSPHHAPSAALNAPIAGQIYRSAGLPYAASIESMQARTVEVGCGPGQHPLREGATNEIRLDTRQALVVMAGPGESRGLSHFSYLGCRIGAIFDNQIKTLRCYPGILVFGIRTMLRRAPPIFCMVLRAYFAIGLKPKSMLAGRGLSCTAVISASY